MNEAVVLLVVFGVLLLAGVPIAFTLGLAAFAALAVNQNRNACYLEVIRPQHLAIR